MATSPDNMPTHYETQQTTETRTTTMDRSYLTTKEGILKILEMVFSFCLFITGTVGGWIAGMGLLSFTGLAALITVTILFVFRLFTLYNRLPSNIPWTLIEFIHYVIYDVLYLLSAIVSTVCALGSSTCGAGAFFSWVGLIIFAVDTFFCFQRWRSGAPPSPEVQTTTHVTTTETTTHY